VRETAIVAEKDFSRSTSSSWFVAAHRRRQQNIRELHAIIIDELSLMTPELFEFLDKTLRAIRKSHHPFGGIKIIAVGDPGQIPPIPLRGEEVQYVFEATLWKSLTFEHAVLQKVLRQNDEFFIDILAHVRLGQTKPFKTWPEPLRAGLLARVGALVLDSDGEPFPATTFVRETNREVDERNDKRLREIGGSTTNFMPRAVFVGPDGKETRGHLDDVIRLSENEDLEKAVKDQLPEKAARIASLKIGATVVLTHNVNQDEGLFNGSVGVVIDVTPTGAEVRFRHGTASVSHAQSEVVVPTGGKLVVEWLPLRAGYSVTIEKCQGMTLTSANVKLSRRMGHGKAYTAIGRVATLDSLTIDCGDSDPAALFESAFNTSEAALEFLEMASAKCVVAEAAAAADASADADAQDV
jgi:ATP-dependent exoDNAse (exonuclease V) alpha subunit